MASDKDFELDDLDSFTFEDGSSNSPETEPYGVWVKKGPEDVLETDPTSSDDSPVLGDEDFLSSDELANLDDTFEFVSVPATPESNPEENLVTEEPSENKEFDEISLDDFVSFDDDQDPSGSPALMADSEDSASALASEEEVNEEFLDIDIEIDDHIDDEELEIIEGVKPQSPGFEVTEMTGAEEIDLSEFGDFDDGPSPLASSPAEDESFVELDVSAHKSLDSEKNEDFFEEEIFDSSESDDDFAKSFDDVLSAEKGTPLVTDPIEPDLNHIVALEEDLISGIQNQSPPSPSDDLASKILAKIEDELSSMKKEIFALKSEISSLRKTPGEGVGPLQSDEKSSGFFEEEEDEVIALTGDELDNILSSASIVEDATPVEETLDESFEDSDDTPEIQNLIETDDMGEILTTEEEPDEEAPGMSDDDFLAGTSLSDDLDDDFSEELDGGAIPDSIELEEETINVLGDEDIPPFDKEEIDLSLDLEEALEMSPSVDEPIDEAAEESTEILSETEDSDLEIPFDDEISLEEQEETAPKNREEAFERGERQAPPLSPLSSTEDDDSSPTQGAAPSPSGSKIPENLKLEIRSVLSYMDKLLASLPDEKIQEFAESEHFEVYKKLFEELGLLEE